MYPVSGHICPYHSRTTIRFKGCISEHLPVDAAILERWVYKNFANPQRLQTLNSSKFCSKFTCILHLHLGHWMHAYAYPKLDANIVSTVWSTGLQLVAPSPCHCWDEWWIPGRDRCPTLRTLSFVFARSAAYETGCCLAALWQQCCLVAMNYWAGEPSRRLLLTIFQGELLMKSGLAMALEKACEIVAMSWGSFNFLNKHLPTASWWFQPVWKILINEVLYESSPIQYSIYLCIYIYTDTFIYGT